MVRTKEAFWINGKIPTNPVFVPLESEEETYSTLGSFFSSSSLNYCADLGLFVS